MTASDAVPDDRASGDGATRVLLIDDSKVFRKVVQAELRDAGWDVQVAADGQEALSVVPSFRPHVVVCDLNMPGLDGVEVVSRLTKADRSLPVIMHSDDGELPRVLQCIHEGAFDFVPKSKDLRALLAAVDRAAAHRSLLAENTRMADELRVLNRDLEQRVAARTAQLVEAERRMAVAQYENELAIARRIQTSILPPRLEVRGYEVAARMVTAGEVGGDYYDLQATTDGGCWLGIGDVSGHGLTAGLMMLMLQSGLASLMQADAGADPATLLELLNRVFYENVRVRLKRDDFATMSLFRFFRDGRFVVAGAHEDILVCRARTGRCERIATSGIWLGVKAEIAVTLENAANRLEPGDMVVLYTDGITEARRPNDREQFGIERLEAAIEELAGGPLAELCDEILRRLAAWASPNEDDQTLVVMRFAAQKPPAG
jgi:serine phosphatase RsbU (regulator of sigma subunit)